MFVLIEKPAVESSRNYNLRSRQSSVANAPAESGQVSAPDTSIETIRSITSVVKRGEPKSRKANLTSLIEEHITGGDISIKRKKEELNSTSSSVAYIII